MSEIDRIIGLQIRSARRKKRLTLSSLSEKLNMSLQAMTQCEEGIVRCSPAKLHEIALALEVPLDYFHEPIGGGSPSASVGNDSAPTDAEIAQFVSLFSNVKSPYERDNLLSMLKLLAKS